MEPDVCIENACRIRVVVVAIGEVPMSNLRDYVDMVTQHTRIELSSVSSFYTEHQKSPFTLQPWESGCLRFKYMIGKTKRSQWEDFQPHRKVHGLIGLCHCPASQDLDAAYERFVELCNYYPSAQTRRCFAFHPSDEQVEQDDKKRQHMVLFPPADRQTLRQHMQTLMQDFAASILMGFESRVLLAEPMGATLTTPMDSHVSLSSEEVSKAKRRRLERVQKFMGDYSLLAGSPADAISHFATAIELSRHTGDFFWNAGAIEGSICALVIEQSTQTDHLLDDEVKFRYYEVIQFYRRASALVFEVEAALKIARFLCRKERGKEMSREVAELLTGVLEVGRNMTDANDRVVLFVEVARLFGTLGYERKSAFFSRQVAQFYQLQDNPKAAKSALQILLLAAKSYGVYNKKESLKHSDASTKDQYEITEGQCGDQWNFLQINVLGDILAAAVRAGDPLTAWTAGARLVRFHYPFITPSAQMSLVTALSSASARLPPGTRCSDPALPFIRFLSFPPLPSETDIIRKVPGKKDWWVESTTSGPFIYTPISVKVGDAHPSKGTTITWVVGESVEVLVEVANPCAFDVSIQDMSLSVDGAAFEAFPLSVSLPPNTSQVLSLSGVPRETGSVAVRGCFVNFTGVTTEHLFEDVETLLIQAAKGVALVDPFRGAEHRSIGISIPPIVVTPPLPLLAAHVVGGDGDIVLYEGEIREIQISLVNVGTVPVVEANLTLSGKQREHSLHFKHANVEAALPLQPGATVLIPVELRAGQTITETERGSAKTFPLMLVHYSGPEEGEVPVGRQLPLPLQLRVQKGLSLVQARLLSMDVPAQVSTRLLDINNCQKVEAAGDGLVKIDPYRGTWSLQLLEVELWNPTEVPFEIRVTLDRIDGVADDDGLACPATRIDSKYSSRLLIPLERLKLPALDKVFIHHVPLGTNGTDAEDKELSESIQEVSSRICVRWQSGRNSVGELHVGDAIRAALQASMAEVLTLNPLTFGFRLGKKEVGTNKDDVLAHELTPIEMLVRNNTKDPISLALSVTCRDVTGANCFNSTGMDQNQSVMWAGALNGIDMEVPALGEHMHSFVLCFLVPGEYTLLGAAVIRDPLKGHSKQLQTAAEQPVCYSGPPFAVHVVGAS